MRSALHDEEWWGFEPAEVLLPRTVAYRYWKHLFKTEIAMTRERERLRMAHSQDWSDLGAHVRKSILIAWHQTALDMAGVLFSLRLPGAQILFEAAVTGILRSGYSAVALRQ